jgi:hypothetical protein
MSLRFPTSTTTDEVTVWLQMESFEPENSFEVDNHGKSTGKKIQILAPQTIEDNHGQRYGGTTQKMIAVMRSEGDWSDTIEAAVRSVSDAIVNPFAGQAAGILSQRGPNPYEQKIYEAPEFRTFTFRWELAPLNASEGQELADIIKQLTKSSYPELMETTSAQWRFPDQFRLKFVAANPAPPATLRRGSGGATNQPSASISVIPVKFGKCVLTNVSTNYTGAGQFRIT